MAARKFSMTTVACFYHDSCFCSCFFDIMARNWPWEVAIFQVKQLLGSKRLAWSQAFICKTPKLESIPLGTSSFRFFDCRSPSTCPNHLGTVARQLKTNSMLQSFLKLFKCPNLKLAYLSFSWLFYHTHSFLWQAIF